MASELFLTGTGAEIVAIIDIDGRVVGDGKEGPVTGRIRTTYSKIVTAELAEYTRWLTPVW